MLERLKGTWQPGQTTMPCNAGSGKFILLTPEMLPKTGLFTAKFVPVMDPNFFVITGSGWSDQRLKIECDRTSSVQNNIVGNHKFNSA